MTDEEILKLSEACYIDTLFPKKIIEFARYIEELATQTAIDIAVRYGSNDGARHKDWVIDQMVRALAGDRYKQVVAEAKSGEDGPDTYDWHVGIAP